MYYISTCGHSMLFHAVQLHALPRERFQYRKMSSCITDYNIQQKNNKPNGTLKSNPKSSHSSKNNKNAENIKLATNDKSEKTGCHAITTVKLLITKNIEKI